MIALLDTLGPSIWHATCQASILALLIALLLKCFGERLAPRWRFLLWGVVVVRLLIVVTPVAPWSLFNLNPWETEANTRTMTHHEVEPTWETSPPAFDVTSDLEGPVAESPQVHEKMPSRTEFTATGEPPSPTTGASQIETSWGSMLYDSTFITRLLSAIWLAGCLILSLKLMFTALVLRRRLNICRPVTDDSLLELLETSCRRIGLKKIPALLVTPECLSPCTVGIWHPRIVLPESVATDSSTARLNHVIAHELGHLVRRDLWTNWLLLATQILHWFNPVAWWTVREMQAEREAACDDLAFSSLNESDRSTYAATIVELSSSLSPSVIAPGLVGLFSSNCRVKTRVERLVRPSPRKTLHRPIAAGMLLAIAMIGLTDAIPDVTAQARQDTSPSGPEASDSGKEEQSDSNIHVVTGRCFENSTREPLAGITVRLYRVVGCTSPPEEIAKTVSFGDGRYVFTDLEPPRPENQIDRLAYAVFGFDDDRPVSISFMNTDDGGNEIVDLQMTRETSMLTGTVLDTQGRPVAGANVMPHFVSGTPVPGLNSTTTDADGRFILDNLGVYKRRSGREISTYIRVLHPDYPAASSKATQLPADLVVTLSSGCKVTGIVKDEITGKPAEGALITARRIDEYGMFYASTDESGLFRLVVPEGRYDFLVDAEDRVCVATTGQECLVDETVKLSEFKLIAGGFISGRVINTVTGKPVTLGPNGEPIRICLMGPSRPSGRSIDSIYMAVVDQSGRFTLRAAPGENYPYFVNIHGDRMGWDTRKQAPVLVKKGETTSYNMLITPPASPEDKLKAARQVVEALSKQPAERIAQILAEFRKLSHTVDEEVLWCSLMRELVAMGPEAVPQLCAELDRTTEDRAIRRLAFALRAIGDTRAVPALIRAIPKTLLPSSSDYGLLVGDKELTEFMQTYDLDRGKGGQYFDLGRPVREIFETLHTLTQQDFQDAELFSISLSEDLRRQVLQRRIYTRQAHRWQTWWEQNVRDFTDEAAYQKVNLKVVAEALPSTPQILGKTARINGVWQGAVLSPPIQKGKHAWHFMDLDTGYRPLWPDNISREEASTDPEKVIEWAMERGVDLMCVVHRSADGTETYVLQALKMKVEEISRRDLRNLDRQVAIGTLPEGRPVGELLMHYDSDSQKLVPDANALFLFVTREGNRGVIETTDRVKRVVDLTGQPSGPTPGIGFHLGVRFNLKEIIP